jgi:sugar lactone lactonase YvrE
MELFASGLSMGESPRWHADRLWVCDWTAGQVLSFGADGERRVELELTGWPFSIDWLPDDRALLTSPTGVITADGAPYGGTGQPWNEIVVDAGGITYVNAAGFDLMAGEDPRPGFVWAILPGGSSRRVADDVMFPNGMAITPDGGTLIIAESYRRCLTAFDIGADGALTGRRLWADLGEHAPDGICLDADGAVWYATVPGRCCVRVAEGGAVLDRVDADRGCFACMLGGPDGRTLYVIANEWAGVQGVGGRTGQILTHPAAAPHAGRP